HFHWTFLFSLPDCSGFTAVCAIRTDDWHIFVPMPYAATNRLHRRLVEPLLALLIQGISPDRLALCVAVGVVVGNIPILGVSTLTCSIVALVFRLNLPAILLVQAAMAPTQVLLMIPFVRLGEWITRAPPQPVSINAALALMAQ